MVKVDKPKKNVFDLSHDVKLSLDMGKLVPILCMECIPGDKHTISCESLLRFSPLISPVMHRYDVTMHYFFVPNRLLWNNWEKYITNTKLDVTSELPAFPYLTMLADNSNHPIGSLPDYFGIPYNLDTIVNSKDINVSALPFAAYQCIWSNYYRDQNNNIAPSDQFWQLTDGDNNFNSLLLSLQERCWEHDYFTSALPFAQKGDPVTIPGNIGLVLDNSGLPQGSPVYVDATGSGAVGGPADFDSGSSLIDGNSNPTYLDPRGSLASEGTINDLRRAFSLQRWLEKAARGGSRYIEWLRTMFGVISSDARLQRPEYITGVKSPVVISEVLNTTGTDDAPQGAMSGHAVGVTSGNYGSYYCEEHGYIIGIMSVTPKTAYFQGIDRQFLKINNPTEFFFSDFANIGEQEVDLNELYAYYDDAQQNTFGYLPRYTEYRFMSNRVCSNFRTDLDFWHQARKFANPPQLNAGFTTCDPDKRIFAVVDPEVNSLYATVYNKIKSVRPIPKYGTPSY